ncbi:MAG: SDR family NAD(P)-dependent oxidoreductase, partial [Microbacterium sp.]|nr:SDR family NAD(P)-dependent oxidoreductase [Microbacterium sp.]
MGELEGKVGVITGGCSGIGLATARKFVAEGAEVVIGDVDAVNGPRIAEELGGAFIQVDVTDAAQVGAMFALNRDIMI